MRRLLALMMGAASLAAAAQITYPYNPDSDSNGLIGVPDLQSFLAVYGNSFDSDSILIDGGDFVMLIQTLDSLVQVLENQNASNASGNVMPVLNGYEFPSPATLPIGWFAFDRDLDRIRVVEEEISESSHPSSAYLFEEMEGISLGNYCSETNEEYTIYFSVVDSLMAAGFSALQACSGPTYGTLLSSAPLPVGFSETMLIDGDLPWQSMSTTSGSLLLVPNRVYRLTWRIFMYNGNLATQFETRPLGNFSVPENIEMLGVSKEILGVGIEFGVNRVPVLEGPAFRITDTSSRHYELID